MSKSTAQAIRLVINSFPNLVKAHSLKRPFPAVPSSGSRYVDGTAGHDVKAPPSPEQKIDVNLCTLSLKATSHKLKNPF